MIAGRMPLPYYARLSRKDKAIYRQSVAVPPPQLRPDRELREATDALEVALDTGRRVSVRKHAQRLFDELCDRLEVPRVKVSVRERRPQSDDSELQGLYEREEGEVAVITAWMRTGTNAKIVKFRTFLRTLLHELVHHLDYELYALDDSFHTEGFFKRESVLMRALRPPRPKARSAPVDTAAASATAERRAPDPRQLSLF